MASERAPRFGTFLVCNYSPAGNFIAQPPYQVGAGTNAACSAGTPTNHAPIANAGPDRTVIATPTIDIVIDGSGSWIPTVMRLTYLWTSTSPHMAC